MNTRNKGLFIWNIIMGIIFIGGGLFFAWYKSPIILSFNSAEKVYNDGYIFTYDAEDISDSYYAVAVHDLLDTGYSSDNNKSEIYALLADDSIYLLEAKLNDRKMQAMLETYDNYSKEEHSEDEQAPVNYLLVESHYDTYGSLDEIVNEIDPDHSYRNNNSLRDGIYLSKVSLAGEIFFALAGTLVLLAIGIGTIISAFRRKGANEVTYEKLCELDERLRDNVNELDNIADYVDKSLGAYIYKDHLILNTKFGFDMFDLSNLVWIYHNITKHRAYFLITVSTDFALQINTFENGKFRTQRVIVSNNKKAEGDVQSLISYIGTHYPNIITGFSTEAKASYRDFKASHSYN